jgi:hypothetical protein
MCAAGNEDAFGTKTYEIVRALSARQMKVQHVFWAFPKNSNAAKADARRAKQE